MTTDERIDAIAITLEQLAALTAALAGTVAAHDRQIGKILDESEKHGAQMAELTREWQAYLRRIPPQ